MDADRFDALTRRVVVAAGSRRTVLRRLAGSIAALAAAGALEAPAAAARKTCGNGKKACGKRCIPKTGCCTDRKQGLWMRDKVTTGCRSCAKGKLKSSCPDGKRCCPDGKCGARCCANGYACDQLCSGPKGNDYCCPPDRPMAMCKNCYPVGSIQCDGYCCGPKTTCCGPNVQRCCAEGYECVLTAAGYGCNKA